MNVQYTDTFTIIACSIIAGAFVISWIYIAKTDSVKFANRKEWINQLPSVVSALGVLGTFLGITKGLMFFDTSDLDKSIPLLLDGLKTAFFTSLLGMFGSLILNRVVSHRIDIENKESEEQKAAKLIVETLKTNQNNLPSILSNSNKDLVKILSEDDTIRSIHSDVEQLKDDIEELKGHIQEIKNHNIEIINNLKAIRTSSADAVEELPRLRAVAVTATASISAIDNNIEELNSSINNIESATSEINDSVRTLQSNEEEDF